MDILFNSNRLGIWLRIRGLDICSEGIKCVLVVNVTGNETNPALDVCSDRIQRSHGNKLDK